jgi:hypothetical protein
MAVRLLIVAASIVVTGCGANARYAHDCSWPSTHQTQPLNLDHTADLRHLSDDAQVAEDVAIRHADLTEGTGSRRRNVERYRDRREACKAALFAIVSRQHNVPIAEVEQAVGRRRMWLDALVMLSFAAIYVLVAYQIAARLFRGALADSAALAIGMSLAVAVALGVIGVLAGDVWAGLIESIRVGNGHMSYRVERVPWRQHPIQLFACGTALFIAVAGVRWKRTQSV